MNTQIRVKNLFKYYDKDRVRLGRSALDSVVWALRGVLSKRRTAGVSQALSCRDRYWALEDISFEVKPGEVVGIVGSNGSGKSTLLRILSRVTEPTKGQARVRGRVAALLEIGTGFHPELSGRDNVFLNASILGMKKEEITRQFDSIISFAELESFVDQPVKHYSSGMYVRLAFSVAAHLPHEILLLDEILAVGDVAFQRKCLKKVGDLARSGRTILFVSHHMDSIRRICSRVLWLDSGRLCHDGAPMETISRYLRRAFESDKATSSRVFTAPYRFRNRIPVLLHSIEIKNRYDVVSSRFGVNDPVRIAIDWESLSDIRKLRIGFVLQTSDGSDVLTLLDAPGWDLPSQPQGRWISSCEIPGGLLNEGPYVIDVGADSQDGYDFTLGRTGPVIGFEVADAASMHVDKGSACEKKWPGLFLMDLQWARTVAC